MLNLYRRLWRLTRSTQLLLVCLAIVVAILAAVQLDYQKTIVNGLTEDLAQRDLLLLGAQFLGVLVLSGALKFAMSYRGSLLSESDIRTLRTELYRAHAGPEGVRDDRSKHPTPLGPMIVSEAEEVGKFAGVAVATPVVEVGIMVSVIGFIAATQPLLGVFVIVIVGLQAATALGFQKHINRRVAERVKVIRRVSGRIAPADETAFDQAVLADFDEIYEARRGVFLFKMSTKFVLNATNAVATAGVLTLGGWLVLEGRTDIGTVVADLAGLARIAQPWRSLIAFYRNLSAVRVKYELLKAALPA